jgi:hypothetical protein
MSSLKRSCVSMRSAICDQRYRVGVCAGQGAAPQPKSQRGCKTIGVTDVTITYSRPAVKGERSGVTQLQNKPAQKAKLLSTTKTFAPRMLRLFRGDTCGALVPTRPRFSK